MKQLVLFLTIGVLACGVFCTKESPTTFQSDTESVKAPQTNASTLAYELIRQAQWPLEDQVEVPNGLDPSLMKRRPKDRTLEGYLQCEREQLTHNIAHYTFKVYVGPTMYDVFALHRVVKERRVAQPIRTDKTFFYQHGDAKDFAGMTLPGTLSPNTADDFGIALFLAEHDVDVWGIDQAWTLTPAEISESSFMKDWGLQKQVDDLKMAMSIARFTRLFTGCGFAPMNLCGYSSGVITGFALLNEETQMLPIMRNVAGFIPVDVPVKTDDEDVKEVFRNEYDRVKEMIDAGEYADFIAFSLVADLARSDPDGDSPLIPGFTNKQVALFFGAGPLYEIIHYHFLAGIWENEFPTGFEYVTYEQWLDFMAAAPPWEAAQFIADYCKIITDIEDVPFDDYFAQIQVPIFFVGAAGGMGNWLPYSSTQIGSPDISMHIVQLKSAEEALFDFAHIDLFIAHNAETEAWEPILDWIESHISHWPS